MVRIGVPEGGIIIVPDCISYPSTGRIRTLSIFYDNLGKCMECGDNWRCETSKAPVKSSPPTTRFSQAGCPSCYPTNGVSEH